jgi:hypothetical protein
LSNGPILQKQLLSGLRTDSTEVLREHISCKSCDADSEIHELMEPEPTILQ